MHFAKASAAVGSWQVTAHLYEQQIFIGAIAVTQACCESVLQSSTDSGRCILPKPGLQCIGVGSLHTPARQSYGAGRHLLKLHGGMRYTNSLQTPRVLSRCHLWLA